jgi:hypothetical protein
MRLGNHISGITGGFIKVNSSVRTKFMVETIINLKNNRAKAATSSSVLTSEATVRMKRFLGKLNERGLRSGGEPLRVTLHDIRKVREKGKWWLVGASWKNDDVSFEPVKSNSREEEDALLTLAREQRMNTEIRRAVFIALMGSEGLLPLCPRSNVRITLTPRHGSYFFLSRKLRGMRSPGSWFTAVRMKVITTPSTVLWRNDYVRLRVRLKFPELCAWVSNSICGALSANGERRPRIWVGQRNRMTCLTTKQN